MGIVVGPLIREQYMRRVTSGVHGDLTVMIRLRHMPVLGLSVMFDLPLDHEVHPMDHANGGHAERLKVRNFGAWFRLLFLIWRVLFQSSHIWEIRSSSESSRTYRKGRDLSVRHANNAFCGIVG